MARINDGSLFADGAGADQGGGELAAVGEGHADTDEGEDAHGEARRRSAGGAQVAVLAAAVDVGAAQVEDDPLQVPVAVEGGGERGGKDGPEGALGLADVEDEGAAVGERVGAEDVGEDRPFP